MGKDIILAVETSSIACSVALLIPIADEVKIHEVWQLAPRQHTELILPMLDEVFDQAGCQLSDVTALAFGCGPGAFTGVRIATSVIQAISFASQTKVVSISSLAAMAQGQYRQALTQNIVVASDARMQEVYLGCYQNINGSMRLVGEEKLLKPEKIAQNIRPFCLSLHKETWSAIGNGWFEYRQFIDLHANELAYDTLISDCLPHAQDIAYLAQQKIAKKQYGDAQTALPVYLRNNVAKKSKQQILEAKIKEKL